MWGGRERDYNWGRGSRNHISGLEGSQAVPARPTVVMHMIGINFLYLTFDEVQAFIERIELVSP
jgi:hypothetical protein